MKYSLKLQLLIMLFSAPTKSKKASKSIIFYLSETKLPIAFPLAQCLAFPQKLLSNNKPSFFKQPWASSHQEKQSQNPGLQIKKRHTCSRYCQRTRKNFHLVL
jgi:hypothetical protein